MTRRWDAILAFAVLACAVACGEPSSESNQESAGGVPTEITAGTDSAQGGDSGTSTAGQSSMSDTAGAMGAGVMNPTRPANQPETMGGQVMTGGGSAPGGAEARNDETPVMEQAEAVPAQEERIYDSGFIRFTALEGVGLIGQTSVGLTLLTDGRTITFGESFGEFISAATVAGTHLVLSSAGLFVLVDDTLEESPLTASLPRVVAMMAHPDSVLWLATEEGLYRWADGSIRRFMTTEAGIRWSNVRLSPGHLNGLDVVWAIEGQVVIAMGADEMGPRAWSFELAESAQDITTNAEGLWVATQSTLSVLSKSGDWTVWQKPESVAVVAGHVENSALWLSNGRDLWLWRDGRLRPRSDAPPHTTLKVTADGSALLGNLDGIFKIIAGRFVQVFGLENRVTGDVSVRVSPSDDALVGVVTGILDSGDPLEIAGPPWTFDLKLADVSPGNHVLEVKVRYTDEREATARVEFLGPPSWSMDIDPLQQVHCIRCHGDGGSAHLMMDIQAWTTEIAMIIDDVETGRMPLNGSSMTQDEIDLIRGWQAAGFME